MSAEFEFNTESFTEAQKLGELLERELCQRRLPEILGAIRGGQTVAFGPLSVSNQGLSCSWGSVAWAEVTSVKISQGQVTIDKRGKWFSWEKVSAAEIPNLVLFLSVVDSMVGINR